MMGDVLQTLLLASARQRSFGVGHCESAENYIYTWPGVKGKSA